MIIWKNIDNFNPLGTCLLSNEHKNILKSLKYQVEESNYPCVLKSVYVSYIYI